MNKTKKLNSNLNSNTYTLKKNKTQKTFRTKNKLMGLEAEIKWLDLLRKKYSNLIDNNKNNIYSLKDATSFDDGKIIDHELKCRSCNHNSFQGLMIGNNKYVHSLSQLKLGIPTFYYFWCKNGLFLFKFEDELKQKNCFIFGTNGNIQGGELATDVVDIKAEYLMPYEA